MFTEIFKGIFSFNSINSPRHEFIGKPFDFKKSETLSELESRIRLPVCNLKQVHGNKILDLRKRKWEKDIEGDAIISNRGVATPCALGVFTADCLPILIWNSSLVSAIHAGWRGVASGIVEKVIGEFDKSEPITLIIGPCASGTSYEVGQEVIDQIGEHADYKKNDSKIFLDLARTVQNKLTNFRNLKSHVIGKCTIQNSNFHSHRREGEKRGSNFSWISNE